MGAQETAAVTGSSTNPLAALSQELKDVLAEAGVPFSDEQERAIALMMEERRRATEELFGNLLDFSAGPTQRQEADRLASAIEWMRGEFLRSLNAFLTPEQAEVWIEHMSTSAGWAEAAGRASSRTAQTQFVRINNNAFTAEDANYSGGSGGGGGFGGGGFGGGGGGAFRGGGGGNRGGGAGGTEVIQRGGAGAWHGNGQFLLKDDALNARNAFAGNKPPYQERRLNVDVSGPSIPGRLTSAIGYNQTEAKNVTTVNATLPEGPFALGITRPNTFRNLMMRNTVQLADAHSLNVFGRIARETSLDQGIGGFTLPERASDSLRNQGNVGLRQFSTLSSRSIFESRLQLNSNGGETVPHTHGVRINVLDAFSSGGAQNRTEDDNRNVEFGTLYTRMGDRVTLKTGFDGNQRHERSFSESNFGGTFTFSSLQAYMTGTPLTYRVTRGTPEVETRQLEVAAFVQTDVTINPQLTLLFGARYEAQQNLQDYNNLAPRVGFAYAPGPATVIRGGGGIFYSRLQSGMVERQRRFDGTRQFEIVIDNPSYPDPFAAGTVRTTLQSVRVTDPHLVAPYFAVGMISLERTFLSNLLFTATYDWQREYHKLRTRNINAPFDARADVLRACSPETPDAFCIKPDPTRGNVITLESTGNDIKHTLRLSVRKRFSIFNGTLNYSAQHVRGDVQGGAGTLASDAYDLRADWGRSPQPTHTINGNLNASLPLGVFVSGAMSFHSGRFYTITTGRDDNRDSNVDDRPVGVMPNSERGPKYLNFDFNISKAFFLGGGGSATSGMNINVFANMTNAFNHVHYGTPSGVMTSPNFRRITSATDPREIEIGLRFQF